MKYLEQYLYGFFFASGIVALVYVVEKFFNYSAFK